ncbi:MAG: ATP-binding cassette domain-containing protein [Tepidibacter sp.]|jgi:putative ABC transport system ATP-binding protein|uniref:ABC transporter ATP-binding protein n=1 Tax=Tepidibacter sp. TaxID=2529387 RepID=UPI0025E438D6|nr:ATP-binding cassette domain-containing protein [Tepidibacter sp.]MCT4507336.1 ATP-binding cassette domain-containing protein [Tepidibacter sp.]
MIQIRNLCKTFNKNTINEKQVFDKLSLDIEEGDFITIIGSNGAGKSTLLNMISGSLDKDSGVINLDNKDISSLKEYERSKFIARVYQDPSFGTSPSMTILENLSMAINKGNKFGLSMGISKKNIEYFKEILSELSLGLENQLHTKVSLLSGGQRQALSLIMATIKNPDILLLDEHTAALDPRTSERIIELTEKIVERKKITTFMITHNLNHAISMGNRLLMMHGGKVVLDIKENEKKDLNIDKLLSYFEKIQSKDGLSDRVVFS